MDLYKSIDNNYGLETIVTDLQHNIDQSTHQNKKETFVVLVGGRSDLSLLGNHGNGN